MNNNELQQGHMYRMVGGKPIEFVRWGEILVPKNDPVTREIKGQMSLNISSMTLQEEVSVENHGFTQNDIESLYRR